MYCLYLKSKKVQKSNILFYFLSQIKMTHNVQISLYCNDDEVQHITMEKNELFVVCLNQLFHVQEVY
jgi:ribonucleotide reductase beta subunit family protein with ferritin-like domain